MDLLATTNRGLEAIAVEELDRLTDGQPRVHHPGWVAFEGVPAEIPLLHDRARTIHRVLVSLLDCEFEAFEDIAPLVESVPVEAYVDSGQAIAVRSTRIGEHEFGSPDVADVVGQALIDAFQSATGHRLPVDLDDPDVVFRVTVRHDRLVLALDTTGPQSLHRRPYRVCEHPAPVRPTIAASMLELLDYDGESLSDPFCGSATLPIEAALAASDRSPNAGREGFAFHDLSFVPDDALARVREEVTFDGRTHSDATPAIVGSDTDPEWVACADRNVDAAGVDVELFVGDATHSVPDTEVVAVDLPFNIRSNHGDLRPLYRGFVDAVEASACERLVALTVRPELLPLDPDRVVDFRDGRLEVSIVVASF